MTTLLFTSIMNLGDFLIKLTMKELFVPCRVMFKPNLIKLISMKTKILS